MKKNNAFEHVMVATLVALAIVVALGALLLSCNRESQDAQEQATTPQLKPADSVKSREELYAAVDSADSSSQLATLNSSNSLDSDAGRTLSQTVDKLASKYRLSFLMIDLKTGEGISYNPSEDFYSASAIKGPYVAAVNKYLPSKVHEKDEKTMKKAIVNSDNAAYISLRDEYGSSCMREFMQYSGISTKNAKEHYADFTAQEFAHMWIASYDYFFEEANTRSKWCRGLYTHGYRSFIHREFGDETTVYTKPGWYPGDGYDVQNDAGIVMAKIDGQDRPYVLVVFSSACGEYSKLADLVGDIDAVHTDMSYER